MREDNASWGDMIMTLIDLIWFIYFSPCEFFFVTTCKALNKAAYSWTFLEWSRTCHKISWPKKVNKWVILHYFYLPFYFQYNAGIITKSQLQHIAIAPMTIKQVLKILQTCILTFILVYFIFGMCPRNNEQEYPKYIHFHLFLVFIMVFIVLYFFSLTT